MFRLKKKWTQGQAMVEFAMIILIILFLIFVVVDGARLLFAWATLQFSAREGARYGITGQFDDDVAGNPMARVVSIERRVEGAITALEIDPSATRDQIHYLGIGVCGSRDDPNAPASGDCMGDPALVGPFAGSGRWPIVVKVEYRLPMLTPLTRPIADSVLLRGEVTLTNEPFDQVVGSTLTGGASAPPIPDPEPDLDVDKRDDGYDPATVDEEMEYTVAVSNIGQATAHGVVVTDTLPSGVNFEGAGPGCSQSGDEVICTRSELDPGETYTITVRITPLNAGQITNVARAETVDSELDYNNNIASEQTQVLAPPDEADLQVVKSSTPLTVSVGSTYIYAITVWNYGGLDAANVIVEDILPSTISFDAVPGPMGDQCSHSGELLGGTVTCALGTLTSNNSATINIRVNAEPEAADTTVTNSAVATTTSNEPDTSNNEDTAQTTIIDIPRPDLEVVKQGPINIEAAGDYSYSIQATNLDPDDTATGVVVTDILPDGVLYRTYSVSRGDITCSQINASTVQCEVGNLAPGEQVTILLGVTAPGAPGAVTNQVTIDGNEPDDNGSNDISLATTTVEGRSDVAITKEAPASAEAGTAFPYELTVTNNGPSPARNVSIIDNLPDGVTFVGSSTPQGTCTQSGGTVSCSLGTMASEASVTITIDVIPTQSSSGTITNSATVSTSDTDPDPSNNNSGDVETYVNANTFITLEPICGEAGATVTVSGYNWEDRNNWGDIEISWEGSLLETEPAARNWSATITVPDGAADGEYTITAYQSGPGNNELRAETTFTIPCPTPDLIITAGPTVLSPAPPINADDPVVFAVEVENAGTLDAISQFFVGIYFDPQPAPTDGVTTHIDQSYREAIAAVSGLGVGQTRVVTFTVSDGFGSDGTHDVYAVVDSDPGPTGVIEERYENNNIAGPLSVNVEPGATPTPTPTATPGVTPTPSPTPEEPGNIVGQTFVTSAGGGLQPQANVEVRLFDEASGNLMNTTYSDTEGNYFFSPVDPGSYTLTACVVIDSVEYFYSVSGVVVNAGLTTSEDLFLEQGVCS